MEEFVNFLWFVKIKISPLGIWINTVHAMKTRFYYTNSPVIVNSLDFFYCRKSLRKAAGENSAETACQENVNVGPIISDRLTCDITIYIVFSLTIFLLLSWANLNSYNSTNTPINRIHLKGKVFSFLKKYAEYERKASIIWIILKKKYIFPHEWPKSWL